MKYRSLFLILLLIFRVFVLPINFLRHIGEIKNVNQTFEQIRLKKRRSSYQENIEQTYEAVTATSTVSAIVRRIFPFRFKKVVLPSLNVFIPFYTDRLSTSALSCCRYLRNRTLRI
jgi:hypothetical protein